VNSKTGRVRVGLAPADRFTPRARLDRQLRHNPISQLGSFLT
jgi:hypothetical protein